MASISCRGVTSAGGCRCRSMERLEKFGAKTPAATAVDTWIFEPLCCDRYRAKMHHTGTTYLERSVPGCWLHCRQFTLMTGVDNSHLTRRVVSSCPVWTFSLKSDW